MSNAMRSGKRTLAALAAGALGAGMLMAVSAAPAQAAAGTAVTVANAYPSMTVVGTGETTTALKLAVSVEDAAGNDGTLGDNLEVQVQVTSPTTAPDDTGVVVNITGASPAASGINIESTSTTNLAAMTVSPSSTWSTLLSSGYAGTYTITSRLIVSGSGAVLSTSTTSFRLVTNAAAPAATVRYISGGALQWTPAAVNVIDRFGTTVGNTLQTSGTNNQATFGVALFDAAGGPYIINDDSIVWTATGTGITPTATGGFTTGLAAPGSALYAVSGSGTWSTAGATSVSASVQPVTGTSVGSGTLDVRVAPNQSLAAGNPTVLLTTSPQAVVTAGSSYQVPAGTTSLTFSIATQNGLDDTTVAWNADSSVSGGIVTNSGGAVNMKADQGSVTVSLNGAATGAGEAMSIEVGNFTTGARTLVVVSFAAPVATPDVTPGLGKVGDALPIPGTITTQFGAPLPGTWTLVLKDGAASCTSATGVLATATADAAGAFTITAPASASPLTAGPRSFLLCASNGVGTPTPLAFNATYTATGGVASLTLTSNVTGVTAALRPLVKTPANGTAGLTTPTSAIYTPDQTLTAAQVFAAGESFGLTAAVSPNAAVTFTGTDGVLFTTRVAGSVLWTDAKASVTVPASASAFVNVLATKPGAHVVTASAGSTTQTFAFRAAVPYNAGRTVTVDPTSKVVAPNSFFTVTATVKDIFGNAVPGVGSTGSLTALTGLLSGGGFLTPASGVFPATDSKGQASISYSAPAGTGSAALQVVATGFQEGTIAGAPAPVTSANTAIRVETIAQKAIIIVGERTTVSGKPGVRVEGDTTGIEDGAKVKPWVRFPGESDYSVGSARPVVDGAGDFTWQRKTGKKIYVFFTTEDDVIKSNRVIINAA